MSDREMKSMRNWSARMFAVLRRCCSHPLSQPHFSFSPFLLFSLFPFLLFPSDRKEKRFLQARGFILQVQADGLPSFFRHRSSHDPYFRIFRPQHAAGDGKVLRIPPQKCMGKGNFPKNRGRILRQDIHIGQACPPLVLQDQAGGVHPGAHQVIIHTPGLRDTLPVSLTAAKNKHRTRVLLRIGNRLFQTKLQTFGRNISLDLHNSGFEGNIVTEYEERFSSMGMPIYRLVARLKWLCGVS